MKDINDLFNITILKQKLNLDLKDIKIFCDALKQNEKGRVISNAGGWQSLDFLNKIDNVQFLSDVILYKTKKLALECGFKKDLNFKITSIWANYNEKNNYNIKHIHPNSIFSGVFYVQCDEMNPAKIEFYHPAHDLMGYDWDSDLYESFTKNNSSTWSFEPEENVLIIFPSWLNHEVKYNPSEKTRISISFNMVVC
jgi:uncharacterized protein (TIGR02466 family)